MARPRSSERDEAATAAAARDVDFTHLWRQLRAAGWTARKPIGLATEWTYVKPGATGADDGVFVGDQAVVVYAIKSGLIGKDADSSSSDEDFADGEAVRASQIDTRVQLSQGTANALFRSPASGEEADDTLSQSAVARAFDLSQSVLDADVSSEPEPSPRRSRRAETVAARASLPPLPEESDIEPSEPEPSPLQPRGAADASAGRPDDAEPRAQVRERVARSPARRSRPRARAPPHEPVVANAAEQTEDPDDSDVSAAEPQRPRARQPPRAMRRDVNYISEAEDEDEYESLDSGDSDNVPYDDDDEEVARGVELAEEVVDADAPLLDEAFLRALGGFQPDEELSKADLKRRQDALRATTWEPVRSDFERDVQAYPGLHDQEAHPVPELRRVADDPLKTFFFFMPKSLWVDIADETNRYNSQQVNARARAMRTKQQDERRTPESLKILRRRLRAKEAYGVHKILHLIGILIGHMLAPDNRRFSNHWRMTDDGTTSAGVFGEFMARNRCTDLLRDLHFVDNKAPKTRDKLWKLRAVSGRLQERFLCGWSLPGVFSFDEGVLPATSRRNTTRMFMSDKPHRYGSKLFMTCDSRTAYCHRYEFYAGKRDNGDTASSFDNKTGGAAVVRNLKIVLGGGNGAPRRAHHAVIVDRFYSSVPLAVELLTMNVYVVGTVMTNRLGFPKTVHEPRQTRPASIPRGTFVYSRSTQVPSLVALHWWDRKPVHYLATGAVLTEAVIRRNVKQVGAIQVPSPQVVNDYQRWMGGVDVHDQLRLQKDSLQTSIRLRKYYKSLFLGFVDLALVNAFITHKEARKMEGVRSMDRGEWYSTLRDQLLKLKTADFADTALTPPPGGRAARKRAKTASHALEQNEDWVVVSGVQKHRQRSCKVCSLLRGERKKSFQTTYFCVKCSMDRAKCYLCPTARREFNGAPKTCFQIWHDDFECGKQIPSMLGKRVVLRRPSGAEDGARKKTRRELGLDGDGDAGVEAGIADDADDGACSDESAFER